MMTPPSSTSSGTRNPNAVMLSAIWRICLRECVRAFRRLGVSASIVSQEIANMSHSSFMTHEAKRTASTCVGFQIYYD